MSADAAHQNSTRDELHSRLSAIWVRSKLTNQQRLSVLEAASADLAHGPIGHDREVAAAREAHKLAGGLGSFGFGTASDAARDLEQFWRAQADRRPNGLTLDGVADLLSIVRHELAQPTPMPFDGHDDLPTAVHATSTDDQARASTASNDVDVVLIEDDVTVAEVLARGLTEFGLSVRTFSDGETALPALLGQDARLRARVIVLDYDLPGPDGLVILRSLRAAGVLTDTRVIMLSLTVGREAVARTIDAGASGYIAKPFHWKTVLDRVQACLDGQPALFVIGPGTTRSPAVAGAQPSR